MLLFTITTKYIFSLPRKLVDGYFFSRDKKLVHKMMEDLTLDPKLQEACQQATATNSMTPLIKQELQLTILHRRHMSGQGEVVYEAKKLPVKRELTEAEMEKKRRRKEQNRRAAERCRIKKKKMNDILNVEYIEEQKKSQQLAREVEQLKKERDMLYRALTQHTCTAGSGVTNQAMRNEEFITMTWSPPPPQETWSPPPPKETWSPPPQQEIQQSYRSPSPTDETSVLQMNANGIKSEYQALASCTATQSDILQCYDTNGAFGDPFEEVLMYPFPNDIKTECQPFSPQDTDPLPELDLLDELVASESISPCSPGMMQGRVSISEYMEH